MPALPVSCTVRRGRSLVAGLGHRPSSCDLGCSTFDIADACCASHHAKWDRLRPSARLPKTLIGRPPPSRACVAGRRTPGPAVHAPIVCRGESVTVGASVGVAFDAACQGEPDVLLSRADKGALRGQAQGPGGLPRDGLRTDARLTMPRSRGEERIHRLSAHRSAATRRPDPSGEAPRHGGPTAGFPAALASSSTAAGRRLHARSSSAKSPRTPLGHGSLPRPRATPRLRRRRQARTGPTEKVRAAHRSGANKPAEVILELFAPNA